MCEWGQRRLLTWRDCTSLDLQTSVDQESALLERMQKSGQPCDPGAPGSVLQFRLQQFALVAMAGRVGANLSGPQPQRTHHLLLSPWHPPTVFACIPL